MAMPTPLPTLAKHPEEAPADKARLAGRQLGEQLRVLHDAVGLGPHGDRRVAAQHRRRREHQ